MDAAGMKDSRKVGIEDALASQIKLTHPAQCLIRAGFGGFKQAYHWIHHKVLDPIERLDHGKRRGEPAGVRDGMKKFIHHQGWEHELIALRNLGLSGCQGSGVNRMIGKGKLDEDVAIQASHRGANMSSANSS